MARGQTANVGATRVAPNGYHYTKVDDRGNGAEWVLTHWLTMEKELGRHIAPDEQVRFTSKAARKSPYDPRGIVVIKKKKASMRHRRSIVEYKIKELQAELDDLNAAIGDQIA